MFNFRNFNNKIVYTHLEARGHYSLYSFDEEISYSVNFFNTTKYDKQGNNKYPPLLDGIHYFKNLEERTSIGLIPMKPEDNFNFLTYEIFPYIGDISVLIYKCENYPLCHLDDKILKNQKESKIINHIIMFTIKMSGKKK